MNPSVSLLALAQLRGVGRKNLLRLIRRCGDELRSASHFEPSDVARLAEQHWNVLGLRRPPVPDDVQNGCNRALHILSECHRHEAEFTSILDSTFPQRLARIPDPPIFLFVRGKALHEPIDAALAVVGTREPSEFGRLSAFRISLKTARSGFVIVSGLAVGVDTAAHEGCLAAGGRTIAVLAHGLDRVYPATNKGLAKRILEEGGALVSEYAPGTRAFPGNFVERDRLQIGLSDALLVAETGVKGGTMHTVGFCLEQGKPLACIAHPPQYAAHEKAQGNAHLIETGKATGLKNSDDVNEFCRAVRRGVAPQPGGITHDGHFGFADE